MTARYADTFVGVNDSTVNPPLLADGVRVRANRRVISAVITLAAQASGDTIFIGRRPANSVFLGVSINSDTSLGSATVAVGIAGTAAKYKAAAVHTTVDAPVAYGKAAAVAAAPSNTAEDLILTVGTAALPGSGTMVVDFNYAVAN